ncbi:MAG: hypothetical protein IT366_06270, partial [Candidatus Hydrogenedentes bacterium]|nr:hypothetical protein [Candidatus Hydrogenedentota bacterium]
AVRKLQMVYLFTCGFAFLLTGFALIPASYFDRYMLPAIPPIAVVAALSLGYAPFMRRCIFVAFALTALLTWSVIGLQDYMTWNTARWNAIDILRSKYSAQDNEINGGFEFNGMYTSEEYLRRTRDEPDTFKRKKWWVIGEEYRVSPVDLTEHHNFYEILEKVPYYSWIGFETRYMYAMRLNPQP